MWGRFGSFWLGKEDGGVVGRFQEDALVGKDQREGGEKGCCMVLDKLWQDLNMHACVFPIATSKH
jgi:hypothetical protein